jgi:hypothetical protein
MGRAFVAVADDAYAMYQNPAGLARLKTLQVSSMYSKLIEEVDYTQLGIVNAMSREALGIGYLKASVGGSLLARRDTVTDRIVPEGSGAIGYNSSVLFISYAVDPDKYFPHPYLKNLHLGGSLKIFSQALTGLPTADVSALGHDLDLGLIYTPTPWLSLGAAGYNVLPYNMGGQLMWGSGITESIPCGAKLGWAAKLLGRDGLREVKFLNQELYLAYDYEFFPYNRRPPLNHVGLEWLPGEILSLRIGMDQDAVAVGGGMIGYNNNFSAGIGLTLFRMRFDYAFHTFGELTENTTHFFSLTYGIEKEKPPVYAPPIPQIYLEIIEPDEKSITYSPYLIIKGKLLHPDLVKEIRINGAAANLYPDATFWAVAHLAKYGKNILEIKALSPTGRIQEVKSLIAVRLASFKDIRENHPLLETLGGLVVLGYVSGFKDGTFRPQNSITRADFINILQKTGKAPLIVKGYIAGTLRMQRALTRAEAVTMLSKFAQLKEPVYLYERPFSDVSTKHWAASAIAAAKKQGWLNYLKGKKFMPDQKITRMETIEILSQIEFIKERLGELFDRQDRVVPPETKGI